MRIYSVSSCEVFTQRYTRHVLSNYISNSVFDLTKYSFTESLILRCTQSFQIFQVRAFSSKKYPATALVFRPHLPPTTLANPQHTYLFLLIIFLSILLPDVKRLSPCAVVSHTLPWGVRYPGSSGVGCDLPPHKVILRQRSPCRPFPLVGFSSSTPQPERSFIVF